MSAIEFTEEQLTGAAMTPVRTCIGLAPFDPWTLAAAIAEKHGTTWRQMKEDIRLAYVCAARKELYAELRTRGWSYGKIGRFIGRDHSTIMYAVKGVPPLAKARKKLLWATRGAA